MEKNAILSNDEIRAEISAVNLFADALFAFGPYHAKRLDRFRTPALITKIAPWHPDYSERMTSDRYIDSGRCADHLRIYLLARDIRKACARVLRYGAAPRRALRSNGTAYDARHASVELWNLHCLLYVLVNDLVAVSARAQYSEMVTRKFSRYVVRVWTEYQHNSTTGLSEHRLKDEAYERKHNARAYYQPTFGDLYGEAA
ncbi:hypothetical protein [Paraburkholderia lycopersici]|uniref:Uncharacterized protein n=1 Tax=Paraburkholderia lycopersici TaxID=416944 RepID=A0A1G7A7V6_9BURK|nr:hypothetical protein [Paraburkholderia lycopersici]SDE10909.1 hypothetical protein SAMN05421548_13317 [Paraburkholderia lycopersici]